MTIGSPARVGTRFAERSRRTMPLRSHVVHAIPSASLLVALAVPVVVWVGHVDDAFRWDHASGVWLALAAWADHGVVMPPMHMDPYFAGTRYMPIPIAMLGAITAVTHEPVVAGRVFTLIGTVSLSAVLYRYARLLGASARASLAALVLMVSAPAMTQTITLVRNDTLSVAMGLGGLMTVHREPGSRARWAVGGALAALAVSWKISELWPLAALVCFACLQSGSLRERVTRRLVPLSVAFVGSLVVLTSVAVLLTQGRFFTVLGATLLGNEDSVLAVASWLPRLVDEGVVDSLGLLLPVVLLGWVWTLVDWREAGPLPFATVLAMLVTVVVYVDRGAASNHLTALVALGLLGVLRIGRSWSFGRRQRVALTGATTLLALTSCWATWDGSLHSALTRQHPPFYVAATTAEGPVLSEDPTVSVLAGELPVVSDPFAFRRLALTRPDWSDELDGRIASGDFSRIVLLTEPVQTEPDWYERIHFGRSTIAAICHDYHSTGIVADGRYETFAPGAGPVPANSVCARASY